MCAIRGMSWSLPKLLYLFARYYCPIYLLYSTFYWSKSIYNLSSVKQPSIFRNVILCLAIGIIAEFGVFRDGTLYFSLIFRYSVSTLVATVTTLDFKLPYFPLAEFIFLFIVLGVSIDTGFKMNGRFEPKWGSFG
ncbi:hypothetical protein BDQ17DRAFT_1329650 [Cyathus striatus]|nr:hypothetical protein BDQ17DRAFT_1329650 [Cyathus striatus]